MNSKMLNPSILAIGFAGKSYSEDFSQPSRIQLSCKADYVNAEKKVLECANYLISNPFDRNNLNWESAETFLLLWINGTSDFKFKINKTVCNIIQSNMALVSIYFAYTAKFLLENRDRSTSEKDICDNVLPLLLDYCKNLRN